MAAIDMVFYGASGHGKVIIEAWIACGGTVTGILDDNPAIKKLGDHVVSGKYSSDKFPDRPLIISIGDNKVRKTIVEKLHRMYGKVVHPSAIISASSALDDGSVAMAGVILNAECLIGKHVILNTGCVVDHDCRIGDFVHISPNATLCGGVLVGEGTQVGAGATVIPNVKIGKWATIGAGTVVIEDVPDFALVVGVPGKVKKIRSEF
jgi:sugar O-acyltransferase (sialic acid O-acetyltransferase NeuD family)